MDFERLREPSTWAGIGVMLAALGVSVEGWQLFVQIVTAGAGLLAVMFRERKP